MQAFRPLRFERCWIQQTRETHSQPLRLGDHDCGIRGDYAGASQIPFPLHASEHSS
ncbi:hypothetical protein ACFS07_06100 [Undibacterium arcticum]